MRAALRGPLELRDGSEDVQLEASCPGRRIDAFGQRDKGYAQSLEFIEQQNQVAQVKWIVTKQVKGHFRIHATGGTGRISLICSPRSTSMVGGLMKETPRLLWLPRIVIRSG